MGCLNRDQTIKSINAQVHASKCSIDRVGEGKPQALHNVIDGELGNTKINEDIEKGNDPHPNITSSRCNNHKGVITWPHEDHEKIVPQFDAHYSPMLITNVASTHSPNETSVCTHHYAPSCGHCNHFIQANPTQPNMLIHAMPQPIVNEGNYSFFKTNNMHIERIFWNARLGSKQEGTNNMHNILELDAHNFLNALKGPELEILKVTFLLSCHQISIEYSIPSICNFNTFVVNLLTFMPLI